MRILTDVRLLGRGAHSGIPVFTREVTERLIRKSEDTFELFYPGLRKEKLPPEWLAHPNVSVLDWRVPNKVLDASNKWLHKPDISKHTKADIIFSPHLNNLTKGSLPRVLTVHDLSFVHHPEFFSSKQRLWHYLQNWRKQIEEVEHLIAVSHYTKEDIVKTLGISPERISVAYPGISNEFRTLDPHDAQLLAFQKRHHIQTPYFLYLGALEGRKNVTQLIQAFDLLRTNPKYRGYSLILAGNPGHGAHEIAKAAQYSKSAASIRILSRIADDERVLLYNGAVAFACTSFFEGFGFPTLEAQACGTPVVASNRTSFIETLGTSAILVNPWKPSELADALMSTATDATIRARLIAEGVKNVSRFNWNDTTKHIHTALTRTHHAFYG
jgi:glycosyltransferase involved in cell wall biosynthesis